MDKIAEFVSMTGGYVWGLPLIILLVGTGLYLTAGLKGIQFTKLWHSLYLAFFKRKEEGGKGEITHFQALMTALSATVGTGNIAGVATAIATGGPGALFWMWITGLVGMATKYAEAVLAVKYREDKDGEMRGGPMYYLSKGLKMKWLGSVFALFAAIAAFGIGNMVQTNSVAEALYATFNIDKTITAIALVLLTAAVVLGGIKSIGKVTGTIVPFMIVLYVGAMIVILILKADAVPDAFALIFYHAFNPTAAAGGFAGSAVMQSLKVGVARGIFSNESGLGSSPIAAAAAQTNSPVSQALVSMTQTFIDTIIVCTLSGLVLIVTGAWSNGQTGAELTATAFNTALSGYGGYVVAIGLTFFAYSTVLGWSYYGEKAVEFLAGRKAILPYRVIFIIMAGVGAIAKLDLVWSLSDVFNGLMAFPNLVGLVLLSPIVFSETKKHFNSSRGK